MRFWWSCRLLPSGPPDYLARFLQAYFAWFDIFGKLEANEILQKWRSICLWDITDQYDPATRVYGAYQHYLVWCRMRLWQLRLQLLRMQVQQRDSLQHLQRG